MVVKYVQPVAAGSAVGLVGQVYAQIKRDFGALVEPFTLHSPSPGLLAGAWMACRESQLVGNVRREIKEAVAATVSGINQCRYCVDAHTIMLNATGKIGVARSISKEKYDRISDLRMRLIVKWASATPSPKSEIIIAPPFSVEDAPEIIGTAVFYHYVNRMVTVLLGETPLPFKYDCLKSPLKLLAGLYFSRATHHLKLSGESLRFLSESNLPDGLGWAKRSPVIAGAFSRFAAFVEELGMQVLSEEVQTLINERIRDWNGEDLGLSRHWAMKIVKEVDGASMVAGKLALLTALAPYQVNDEVIHAFRHYFPEDEKLLGVLAWGSFSPSRRIGTWLHTSFNQSA